MARPFTPTQLDLLTTSTLAVTSMIAFIMVYFFRKKMVPCTLETKNGAEHNKHGLPAIINLFDKILSFSYHHRLRHWMPLLGIVDFSPMHLSKLKLEVAKSEGIDVIEDSETFGNFALEQYWTEKLTDLNKKRESGEAIFGPFEWNLKFQGLVNKLRWMIQVEREARRADFKAYAANNPIEKPIFIVGMNRSGTTFLHRLLSLDPTAPVARSPLMYELMNPVQKFPDDPEKDARVKVAELQPAIDFLFMYCHDKHETRADCPEECIFATFNDWAPYDEAELFLSPDYQTLDLSDSYKRYYKVLQLLSFYKTINNKGNNHGMSQHRWVLKAPFHLGNLEYLVKAFPDATIIWAHRNPVECIPSFASILRATDRPYKRTFKGNMHINNIGKFILDYVGMAFTKGDEFISCNEKNSNNTNSFAHIKFSDLVKNPIAAVKELYSEIGYNFTPEYEKILLEYLKEDTRKREEMKKEKDGKKNSKIHKYNIEEYNVTETDVSNHLGWYTAKYINTK